MRKFLYFVIFSPMVIIFVVLAGLALTRNSFERIAYLKTPDRNRLLVYSFQTVPDPVEAREILSSVPWTEGRLTAAYLYSPETAKAARVSMSAAPASYLAATAALEADAPAFSCRLIVAPDGAKGWQGDCAGG